MHQYDNRFVVGCFLPNKAWTRGCMSNENGAQVHLARDVEVDVA
jgi:hypothetical protein